MRKLALVLQNLNHLEEAIAEYRQAIRINPNFLEAHNNLGSLLKQRGDVEEAIAEFRHCLLYTSPSPRD